MFSLINLHTIPHNDITIPHNDITIPHNDKPYLRIQNLCYENRNWTQVHPVSNDHPSDISTTWLDSICGKLKWLDMIWKGTHTCLYKVPQLTVHVRAKAKPWGRRNFAILQDRIVLRHISAVLKVPKNTVASIILKTKKFGTTRTPPTVGRPEKLSNNRRRILVREVTYGHSDRAPEFLCGDGSTFQKDNHLCSTPPIRPLW